MNVTIAIQGGSTMTWRRRLSDFLVGLALGLMRAAMRVDPTRINVELKVYRGWREVKS